MGQVYRARDNRLDRLVAIKVLPDAFAADPDRLARFEREAKTLASLNHPHIAAIYAIEKSAGQYALVMELIEGDDLSERIARGAIPLDEALPIARQIAEALEAAHEQGIIHRDLKPANIKLRLDGTVKVLDFGLAKAVEGAGQAGGAGEAGRTLATLTSPAMMTGVGVILGTAAYMAPEQARSKAVDRRADIWAFGCVLYEMLTGMRLFGGDSVAETLGLIFSREPDLNALPAGTPERVRTLIARCLVKEPRQRLRDIGEARVALDGASDNPAIRPVAQPGQPATSQKRSGLVAALAVAAVAIVALAVPAVTHLRETPAPRPQETRLEINTPVTDSATSFALSPDGRQVVFAASGDGAQRLWLRSFGATAAQPLAGTEGATYPFWSPDGRSIGFFTPSALKRLDLGGGAPQVVAPVTVGAGGTWSADGVIVFAPNGASSKSPLMKVPAAGGSTAAVTTLGPRDSGHRSPFFLPDGRRFLYNVAGAADVAGIYLGSLDGSQPTRLTAAGSNGLWVPDTGLATRSASGSGWLVWVRLGTRTLVGQQLDLERATLVGNTATLADDVVVETISGSQPVVAVSVAGTGLVAYRSGAPSQRQLTWVDRRGNALGIIGSSDVGLRNPRVSADSQRVVVERVGTQTDLWLVDSVRASRFTFTPSNDGFPVWSPDDRRIAFESGQAGSLNLFVKSASGTGPDELLLGSNHTLVPFSWSTDGQFLVYTDYDPQTNADLWILPMAGPRTPSVLLKTPYRETQGMLSPDGRWVAYTSDQSGQNEIYVRRFVPPGPDRSTNNGSDEQWQVSTAGGIYPAWRQDSHELYYLDPAGALNGVPVGGSTTFESAVPTALFTARIYGGGVDTQQGRNYDVAKDGRFLVNMVVGSPTTPITLIQNWNPEAAK